MTSAIGAGRTVGAQGRTSCKRQGGEGVESRGRSRHVADRKGRALWRGPWTGLWTGSPNNPSAAGVVSATTGAVAAARACAAREHASRNA
jgi:hypothetical protein